MENETEKAAAPAMDQGHNAPILMWKTPEFVPTPRGKTWFLVAGVAVVSIIFYAILTDSATTAIVFILLAGLFYMTHNKLPRVVEAKITPLGVSYDNRFFPYNQINAFWVAYHPPFVRALYLRLGERNFKYVKIELDEQNPIEVRKLLAREVPEAEGMGERMIDLLVRVLRLQ